MRELFRQSARGLGTVEEDQTQDGDDLAVFSNGDAMDQEADVFEFVRIVDLGDSGLGDDMEPGVCHHLGGMFADLGRRLDVQKPRVGVVDVDDGSVLV